MKMKFTNEQKELLALLPNALKNSQELTDSAKLVLSNIIFLHGMEDAQKNGYVYRTNTKMMEETDIKSEHTLIGAVRLLELLGYIETKRGKRNEASTYKLLINCSNKCSNNSENCSNEIKTLQNEVLLLQKQVVLLQKEVENLKNCSKKCSTDIDTDIDKEIDKEIDKDSHPHNNNVTIDTLQVSGVDTPNEDWINSFNDEDWIKYEVERSNTGACDFFNIDSFIEDETSGDAMDNNDLNKENEMSDERTNVMNAISEQSERQAKENESSGCVKENEMITSTLGNKNNASKDEHNVPVVSPNESENNLTAPEQKYARWYKNGILVIQGKFYRDPKEFIDKLKRNIDLAKSQMMKKDNYTKRENLINWEGQYDYMLTQLGNLRIFDEDEYLNYRKYVMKPWWNATKQFFPEGWEKIVKNHQK